MNNTQSNTGNIEIRLLGLPTLIINDAPTTLPTQHQVGLLAYLVLKSGEAVDRAQLATLLWGEASEKQARQNLRQALYSIRRKLPPTAVNQLVTDRTTVTFHSTESIWIDVSDFALDEDTRIHNLTIDNLTKRVTLYQGEFLSGVVLNDAPEFEDWLRFQRTRHREMWGHFINELVKKLNHVGRVDEAHRYALEMLQQDETSERAYQHLMRIAAYEEDRDALLNWYERCQTTLENDLNLEPSHETRTLFRKLLTQITGVRHNLPAETTSFIGREEEMKQLDVYLDKPTHRLVSLVGAGGVGKTRLAVETARRRFKRHADGVFFISTQTVTTEEDLLVQIANVLQMDTSGKSLRDEVLNYLSAKHILLIVDNFEQSEVAIPLLEYLLHAAPHLQLIVTSRHRLHIPAERVIALGGLSLDGEDKSDAVHLFTQTAQHVDSSFTLDQQTLPYVRRICRTLEGVPLAIVLAATWVHALPVADIADEIEASLDFLATDHSQLPRRQRSLRTVFDYSWGLLSPAEATTLSRLALLRGDFTRATAQAVSDQPLPSLLHLVRRSLIRFDRATHRYSIHPLIREFALEMLQDDLKSTQRRLLAYFKRCLSQIANLPKQQQDDSYARLYPDFIHIEHAWMIAVQYADRNCLDAMLSGVVALCHEGGQLLKGQQLIDAALPVIAAHDPLRYRLTGYLGELYMLVGDFPVAQTYLESSLNAAQKAGDLDQQAQVMIWLGMLASHSGNNTAARDYHVNVQSLIGRIDEPDLTMVIQSYMEMARTNVLLGHYEEGAANLKKCLHIAESHDYARGIERSLNNLGVIAMRQGKLDVATDYFERCLQYKRITDVLLNLGIVAMIQKNYEDGLSKLEEGASLLRDAGKRQELAQALYNLSEGYYISGDYEKAMARAQEGVSLRRQIEDSRGLALGLLSVGKIHMIRKQYKDAEALFEEALQLVQGNTDVLAAGYIHTSSAQNALLMHDIAAAQEHLQVCHVLFTQIQNARQLYKSQLLKALAIIYENEYATAAGQLLDLLPDDAPLEPEYLTICATLFHKTGQCNHLPELVAYLRECKLSDPFYREHVLPPLLSAYDSQAAPDTPPLAAIRKCLHALVI